MKSKQVSLKEIRIQYYKMRDFEISNLWQRSIFLSALLVLFFSSYGYIASKLFESDINNVIVVNEVCTSIALLGLSFSIIWVMMAKASKAWYEVYENRICTIEQEEELNVNESYRMGAECKPKNLDSNLFTCNAGKYSPSRLNIVIGIFLMIIWFVIAITHYILAVLNFLSDDVCCAVHPIMLTIIPVVFLLITITAFFNMWAKSNALHN